MSTNSWTIHWNISRIGFISTIVPLTMFQRQRIAEFVFRKPLQQFMESRKVFTPTDSMCFHSKTSKYRFEVCSHHSLPLHWQRLTSLKPLLHTHRIPATVLIQPCWQQDPSNAVHSNEMQRTATSHEIPLQREIIVSLNLRQGFRLSDFRPNMTLWMYTSCLLQTRKPEIANRNTEWPRTCETETLFL